MTASSFILTALLIFSLEHHKMSTIHFWRKHTMYGLIYICTCICQLSLIILVWSYLKIYWRLFSLWFGFDMVQNASIIKWQKIYFDNRERLFLLELITSFLCWSKIQHAINLMVQFMLFSTFVMSFVIAIANISFTHYFDSSLFA